MGDKQPGPRDWDPRVRRLLEVPGRWRDAVAVVIAAAALLAGFTVTWALPALVALISVMYSATPRLQGRAAREVDAVAQLDLDSQLRILIDMVTAARSDDSATGHDRKNVAVQRLHEWRRAVGGRGVLAVEAKVLADVVAGRADVAAAQWLGDPTVNAAWKYRLRNGYDGRVYGAEYESAVVQAALNAAAAAVSRLDSDPAREIFTALLDDRDGRSLEEMADAALLLAD